MRSRPVVVLALAVAALTATPAAAAAVTVPASSAVREAYPADLGLVGHGDHRRPVPGEAQEVRWTVRNHGTQPVSVVDLEATVPDGWRLRDGSGCVRRGGGRLLCTLGPLARGEARSVRFRLVVPRHPRFGVERYRASTRFTVDGASYDGPSAGMRVNVVRRR